MAELDIDGKDIIPFEKCLNHTALRRPKIKNNKQKINKSKSV